MSNSLKDILVQITEDIKDQMQDGGWYFNGQRHTSRPTTWDINNQACEEWAMAVQDAIPGSEMLWLDEIDPALEDFPHCVIKYQGRYYDAQALDGVRNIHDLPLVRRVPRECRYLEGI